MDKIVLLRQAKQTSVDIIGKLAEGGAPTTKAIAHAMAPGVFASLQVEACMQKIQEIERKLAMLSSSKSAAHDLGDRRPMFFEGAHSPGRTYGAGDCVQRKGFLWIAMTGTASMPGDTPQWRRIGIDPKHTNHGRDARDD